MIKNKDSMLNSGKKLFHYKTTAKHYNLKKRKEKNKKTRTKIDYH